MKYKLQKQYDDDNMMAYKCKKKNNIHILKCLEINQICLDYKWYLQ